jgi:hypothetical protein
MTILTQRDIPFTRIRPFDRDIADAKPDLYDGVLASKIDKSVRDQLIIPCTEITKLVALNFLEAKSASGRADVAKRQAFHNGAIGARAMHSLQNYGADEAVVTRVLKLTRIVVVC